MLHHQPRSAGNRGIALGALSAFQDVAIGSTAPILGNLAVWFGTPILFLAGALCAIATAGVSLTIAAAPTYTGSTTTPVP